MQHNYLSLVTADFQHSLNRPWGSFRLLVAGRYKKLDNFLTCNRPLQVAAKLQHSLFRPLAVTLLNLFVTVNFRPKGAVPEICSWWERTGGRAIFQNIFVSERFWKLFELFFHSGQLFRRWSEKKLNQSDVLKVYQSDPMFPDLAKFWNFLATFGGFIQYLDKNLKLLWQFFKVIYLKWQFLNSPKSGQTFWLLLQEILLPRPFKMSQSGHTFHNYVLLV